MLATPCHFPRETKGGVNWFLYCSGPCEAPPCLAHPAFGRLAGIATEVYPDSVKMKKQMSYANAKNVPFVALVGETEMAEGRITLKNMTTASRLTNPPPQSLLPRP